MDALLAKLDEEFKKDYEDCWMYDDTCSYVLRHRITDELRSHWNDVCHARAYPNNIPAERIKKHGAIRSVTTSIWNYNDETKEFVEWILDKERSPWRGLFKNMTIHRDDNKIYAVTIDDLDKQDIASSYVLNFLIATRIHSEKEDEFRTWKEARNRGFSEAEALVIATHLYANDGSIQIYQINRGHYPLDSISDYYNDPREGFVNSVSRLEEANPVRSGGLWSACAAPNPINAIWKEFDKKPIKYFNQLGEKPFAKPVYKGAFRDYANDNALRALGLSNVQVKRRDDEITLSWDILLKTKHEWRV